MQLPVIEHQLAILQSERRIYAQRVNDLAGCPERRAEFDGYLQLIDNINEAAIRLARIAPTDFDIH